MSNLTYEIDCDTCGGTGLVNVLVDKTITKYGEHIIGNDWSRIENVWIWFQAFNKNSGGRGIPYYLGIPNYLYETPSGEYLAPFRGELIKVVKDTKDEYREIISLKENKRLKKRGK